MDNELLSIIHDLVQVVMKIEYRLQAVEYTVSKLIDIHEENDKLIKEHVESL